MSPKKEAQESVKSITAINKKSQGFTDEKRTAMKARAQELNAEARANKNKADGENEVLATFDFSDAANLDNGALWLVAFALTELTAAEEAKIVVLVKKAVR